MLTKKEKEELFKEFEERFFKPKTVYIEKVRDVKLPSYAHDDDAGMDITSPIDIDLKPGETKIIPTGFKLIIPQNYEIQIRARSGISLKTPLRLSNGIGTIDSGYRDEIGVIITNTSTKGEEIYELKDASNKEGIYRIKKGDRIAQLVLMHYEKIELKEECNLKEIPKTTRNGGFGSSGI